MNSILQDLDDFIAPSQECVKMIVPEKKQGKVQLMVDADDEDDEAYKV